MRNFLAKLDRQKKLEHVLEDVSLKNISERIKASPDRTILFEDVRGSEYNVVANLFPSRDQMALALGCTKENMLQKIAAAYSSSGRVSVLDDGKAPCQQIISKTDLTKLPIIQHYKEDTKPYITAGVVIAKDPEYGYNLSFHRMSAIAKNRLSIRIVPRHLREFYERAGGELEVAIAIGLPPAVLFAAATTFDTHRNEYAFAAKLMGMLKLVKATSVDLEVPADAELVLEGKITHELTQEGPFVDITGLVDIVREEPVVEINAITHKEKPIYHTILPASTEHRLLMGAPREPVIFDAVNKVTECRGVNLTTGGCCWLHAVISIRMRAPQDARNAILAAFKAHKSLKQVIVVDDDIDIFNPQEVEWALATRFQAGEDIVLLREKGSSLDPSSNPRTRQTSKMGIDATAPEDSEKSFQRVA